MKSLRCVLIQYNGYPYQKWKFGHRDRYKEETLCEDTQGDCHMTMKAELGVMKLWVNECQRLLAIHRKLEEAKKDSFRFQRHHGPTDTLFQMSSLQNCESLSCCLLIYLFVFVSLKLLLLGHQFVVLCFSSPRKLIWMGKLVLLRLV